MDVINYAELMHFAPNGFASLLYHDTGFINKTDMPHICMAVNSANFIAYSLIPAPYFFGMSAENTEYERNRLKKKISVIVRGIKVGEKSGGQLLFYHAPECVTLISGAELLPDAVKGISVTVQKNLPQEVIDKICSYNSWEHYDGLIYVKPIALDAFIYSKSEYRAELPQYGWITSRIWYNSEVVPNG